MLDPRGVEPGPEHPNRACGVCLAARDADAGAVSLGIGFRARDQQLEASRPPGEVLPFDAAQLAPSLGAGEGDQEQGAVAQADKAVVTGRHEPLHLLGRQHLSALGRAAVGAADAAQHVAVRQVARVERMAGVAVGARDGRYLAAQGGPDIALAEVGQVVADQDGASRYWRNLSCGAPQGEMLPVCRVGAHGRRRVGGDEVVLRPQARSRPTGHRHLSCRLAAAGTCGMCGEAVVCRRQLRSHRETITAPSPAFNLR